jgi:lipopolysaccharide biosynthesis glycosyltransferase
MNVVWSTSDLYAEIAATSIVSLLENCRDAEEINVYLIDMGIVRRHKEDIVKMVHSYGRNIFFVEKPDIEKLADTHIDVGRWHISTFSRLFLLHVLPKELKKVLYLDCDTIIRHSLKQLWEMDMEGAWVMSADDCRGAMYRDNIGIDRDSIYTNNGLMMIDLEAWRENNVEPLFIDFIKKYNGDVTYMDQGVLNGVLQPRHKVKLLPIAYNAQTACYDLGYDGLEACRKPVWAYTKSEFDAGIADPIVVHFTTCFLSGTRPWFKNDRHPYRNEFLRYRAMTPWKDAPLWEDHTKVQKKWMTAICRAMPSSLTFALIRVFHVWAYPFARNIKREGKTGNHSSRMT